MERDRRSVLKILAVGVVPLPTVFAGGNGSGLVRIALIADVHKDLMPDAQGRLDDFLARAREWRADAVLEMGDFCTPKPGNREFADAFGKYPGARFHVIGNHDMDGGFTREQVVAQRGMPGRYYSEDLAGVHLVVLDANDVPPGHRGGYPSHVADDQIAWLERDLAATELPVFLFSHQSLERPGCIRSQERVRAVLERARRADGSRKVAACFNGHWHIDHQRVIGGIPYIHINSASYYWLGKPHSHVRFSEEFDARSPCMSSMAPYRKPLHALLEIDLKRGGFTLAGCESSWAGPSPQELGHDFQSLDPLWVAPRCSARSGSIPRA